MMLFSEYRKNKEVQLDEELSPKHIRKAREMVENGHSWYRQDFLNHNQKAAEAFRTSPEGRERIRRTVSIPNMETPDHEVTSLLNQHGYTHTPESYRKGTAFQHTMVGAPERGIPLQPKVVERSISKIIEKHGTPSTMKRFINDPARAGKGEEEYDLVLTGNHEDVYGGSTGRGWSSCTDMEPLKPGESGSRVGTKYMKGEINNHTHHVYILPKGGNLDTDAIGRTSYKHHKGMLTGHQTLLPENRVYGNPTKGFLPAANEFVASLFDKKEGEIYHKNRAVYPDNSEYVHMPQNPSAEALDAAFRGVGNDEIAKDTIREHVNPDHKYKSTILNSVGKSIRTVNDAVSTGDYTKIHAAVKDVGYDFNRKFGSGNEPLYNQFMVDAISAGAKHFDISNPVHAGLRPCNRLGLKLHNEISRNIEAPKDYNQYKNINNFKSTDDYGGRTNITPISKNHTMGKYPMDALVEGHSGDNTLNTDTFKTAHLAVRTGDGNTRSGNVYDAAVHYESKGVPGMSKIVDQLGNELHQKHMMAPDRLAESYKLMKPATRDRISDAAGTDTKSVLKAGKERAKLFTRTNNNV